MTKIDLSKGILEEVKVKANDCIDCKKCFNSCPMMEEYSESPKKLMMNIIEEKKVDKNIPYSCTLCEVCSVKCPKDINLKDMFYSIRKDVFNNNKKSLKSLGYNTIKFHQMSSFSPLFSKTFLKSNTKKIFWPGCSLSSYDSELVLKVYEYLKENTSDISIAFECCGKPTASIGDMDKFEKHYSKLNEVFDKDEIQEVIVACPNCLSTIKSNSNNIKVTSIWEAIKEYGLPDNLKNHYNDLDMSFSLHDPCPIRHEHQIHSAVREILNFLGVKIVEFDKNRENSECCGSGGMVRVTSPGIAEKQSNRRASEAKTDTVVSYCQSCCESMMIAGKSTLHILDFIFNEKVINKEKLTQEKTSTVSKWLTRYNGIKLVKNKKI